MSTTIPYHHLQSLCLPMLPFGMPKKHMEPHVPSTLAMNTHKKESGHGRVVCLPFNKGKAYCAAMGLVYF